MHQSHTRAGWHVAVRILAIGLLTGGLTYTRPARAQDCTLLLPLLQQGFNSVEIARETGWPVNTVEACRRQLSRPIPNSGPAGPPPIGAAGPPPIGAAGPPPIGAAGPPPIGAAGPPPIGAAGPPPLGAAGPPPINRGGRR